MADDNIDKALPNVEQQVTLPGEEEIVEAQETIEESLPGEPEVIEQEDGSVDINFEPGALNQEGTEDHYANLADLLPCLLYTSPSPRDRQKSRMPSSA